MPMGTTRSIRSTSARAILWTTGATLLATLVAVLVVELSVFRKEFETQLGVLGQMTSMYAMPALEFDDPAAGEEALEVLRANPQVVFAVIVNPSGRVFATVGNVPADAASSLGGREGLNAGSGYLDWTQKIQSEGGPLGTLVIRASTARIYTDLVEITFVVLLIGCIAMALAWLAASRMSDRLVGPLEELAKASEAMSQGDLATAMDIDVDRDDEVGTLASTFTGMRRHLRELVTRVGESVVSVSNETERLSEASEAMFAEARKQEVAASETTESIERMSSSVWQVGSIAESLAETAADSSRATTEIDAAVERAAASIDRVFESADSAASSVLEMTAAIRQIGEERGPPGRSDGIHDRVDGGPSRVRLGRRRQRPAHVHVDPAGHRECAARRSRRGRGDRRHARDREQLRRTREDHLRAGRAQPVDPRRAPGHRRRRRADEPARP